MGGGGWAWVVATNAGRGGRGGAGPARRGANPPPPLDSWLAARGAGLDWGGLGIYAAKSIASDEPARVILRLTHRF